MKKEEKHMKNIGYIRVSHTESLNGDSLSSQTRKIKSYCDLHEIELHEVEEECISGSVEVRKRGVLSKVATQLTRGSKLIVARLDRLSRNILNTLQFVQQCKKNGVEIHIVDLGCVTNGGVGQIVFNILSCLAETERLAISERIKTQKQYAKKDRKYIGGALEFGYFKDDNGKLLPNEKEQIILRSMFHLRKNGLSYPKISDEIKKKFGRKIFFQQVHKIMNREHNLKLFENLNTATASLS